MADKLHNPDIDDRKLLVSILKRLDIAAFVWQEEAVFQQLYDQPEWFQSLYQSRAKVTALTHQEYYLCAAFPFIENFIFDAEQLWSLDDDKQLRSGIWTETIDDHEELYLEAIALSIDKVPILLIGNETSNFEIRHKVFQNARNLALKNEKLESAIHLHQRELQHQLEQFYFQENSFNELKRDIEKETTAVLVCREDGGVELFNKALTDIYSLSDENDLQRTSLLDQWVKEAETLYPEIHRVLESGNHWEGEFETRDISSSSRSKKWVRLIIAPVFDESENLAHYICIANDISNIKLSATEIERLTQLDPNTHLPNRRNFWLYLTEQIDTKQTEGKSLALFYIDLDHFKQVNDDLGPKQADFLLKAVANRLKQSLKQKDFIAHLGGDEFAVVINDFADQQSLTAIAQRIMDNIYRDVSFGDFTLNVSASIGIAVYPQHGLKARLLVKNADYAMYHAKEMGRNQFQFSSPYSKRRIKRKIHIEQGLKSALSKDEFRLLYQPQVSLGVRGEHRIEALIRWHHPEYGLMTPADFISIAEETGLIIDIGKWVLKAACEEICILNKAGYRAKMSINVSPKQFKYSNLLEDVKSTLHHYQLDASQLELEVTESIFLEELDHVIEQLVFLRELGISISLDDFGTGYSSLSYLKRLPVNMLKIDRSFIHELPHNQHSRTIVESIIGMAHQLSIEVIAEGIENQEQYEYLRELNCDFLQGFLFHAPLESQELIALYRSLTPMH